MHWTALTSLFTPAVLPNLVRSACFRISIVRTRLKVDRKVFEALVADEFLYLGSLGRHCIFQLTRLPTGRVFSCGLFDD